MCPTGKKTFTSARAAKRMHRRFGDRVRVYTCEVCGGLHVTTQRNDGFDRRKERQSA